MEILRAAGINTGEFYALDKHADAQFVSWVKGPRYKALGKFSLAGDAEHLVQRLSASPEHAANISQNLFEIALRDQATKRPGNTIRYGHTWEAFIDGDTHHARICDENGAPRRFINIYLNEEDIRFLEGESTAVKDGDEISIIPAIAGGA